MRAAVIGATGYTGGLVAAELLRRNVDTRLLGSDERLLSTIIGAKDVRSVRLEEPVSAIDAFRGCDVVISCVAPFTRAGAPIVEATIAASCNYADISGEQRWVRRVYEDSARRPRRPGSA